MLQMVLVPVLASMSLTVTTDILAHAFRRRTGRSSAKPPPEDALILAARVSDALGVPAHADDFCLDVLYPTSVRALPVGLFLCKRPSRGASTTSVCCWLSGLPGAWKARPRRTRTTKRGDARDALCALIEPPSHVLLGDDAHHLRRRGDGGFVDGDGPRTSSRPERVQAGPELLSPQGLRAWSPPGSSPRTSARRS